MRLILFVNILHFISSTIALVKAPSAQEYLGRYQFYRGWSNKRRLLVASGTDKEVEKLRKKATYGYRCELALRHMNLVLLGETICQEIFFFHNESDHKDYTSSRNLSLRLGTDLKRHMEYLFEDLPKPDQFWAVLLGYDGGRKDHYTKLPNFWTVFDRIDDSPVRRSEALQQARNKIRCSNQF